jgi:DnaK suppressor protein
MNDEYLDETQVAELKGILETQLESLMSQTKDNVSQLVEQREADADPLDIAVSESNRDFSLRLADRERRLVEKIRRALVRIGEGEYGACEACGGAIGYGRLLARPVATQCIDCKTEAEQLETRKRVF